MKDGKIMTGKRIWLVFANRRKCHHAEALYNLGYINWVMGRAKFSIGDIVYLFMSDERRVRFKTIVTEDNCIRTDTNYWQTESGTKLTYRLDFISEYSGDLLNEDCLINNGFKGSQSIELPTCNNPELINYISSVFDSMDIQTFVGSDISDSPMIVVDLNSGSHLRHNRGHEELNLTRHPDGRYYGYCPPFDKVDISRLGAKKSQDWISGVTVVYVTKHNLTSDREIVAFCENATIHRKGQDGRSLNRYVIEDNGNRVHCTYSIESDTLVDLTAVEPKFVIKIADYNISMFRMQRFFKGTYPKLDEKIIAYIKAYKQGFEQDDDLSYQSEIQRADLSGRLDLPDKSKEEPETLSGGQTLSVKKDSRIAKQSIARSNYKCLGNQDHKTFNTLKGVPYMEGHHLIPCTYNNAEYFWKTRHRNIDCESNIISLCPTCHRRVHYGSDDEKRSLIEKLYHQRINELRSVGLEIPLVDLLKLYGL